MSSPSLTNLPRPAPPKLLEDAAVCRGMDLAQHVADIAAGKCPLPPYDGHMWFRLVGWEGDGAIFEGDGDARVTNPTGAIHGGVIAGLADSAMGLSAGRLKPPGHFATNMDLNVRFFRAAAHGKLRARAAVAKRGKRALFMECDVTDVSGALVARATSTFLFVVPAAAP